jgi:DNA-binding GntR family transcriptional regulator
MYLWICPNCGAECYDDDQVAAHTCTMESAVASVRRLTEQVNVVSRLHDELFRALNDPAFVRVPRSVLEDAQRRLGWWSNTRESGYAECAKHLLRTYGGDHD